MQSNGGAVGNMICVNNVLQVCGTTGCLVKEGHLISRIIIPAIIYCLVIVAVMSGVILPLARGYPLPKDVPVEELVSPACGAKIREIGKEMWRSPVIIPAQTKVREGWYYTYDCFLLGTL